MKNSIYHFSLKRIIFLTYLIFTVLPSKATILKFKCEGDFGFDVSHCHFAAICRKLNRSHLAPLFCGADQVYFERKEVLVQLNRKHTIAQGDKHCSFRFHFDDNKQP